MTSDRGAAAASWTWDDLAGVVDLAAQNGVHIPGSDFNWRHTWIPLTPTAAASHFHGKIPSSWHASGGGGSGAAEPKTARDVRTAISGVRKAVTQAGSKTGPYGEKNDFGRAPAETGKALDALAAEAAKASPDVQQLGKATAAVDDATSGFGNRLQYDPDVTAAMDKLKQAVIEHQTAAATRGMDMSARHWVATDISGGKSYHTISDPATLRSYTQQAALRGLKLEPAGKPFDPSSLPKSGRDLLAHAAAHGWNTSVYVSQGSDGSPIYNVNAIHPEKKLVSRQSFAGGKRTTYSAEPVSASLDRITRNPREQYAQKGAGAPSARTAADARTLAAEIRSQARTGSPLHSAAKTLAGAVKDITAGRSPVSTVQGTRDALAKHLEGLQAERDRMTGRPGYDLASANEQIERTQGLLSRADTLLAAVKGQLAGGTVRTANTHSWDDLTSVIDLAADQDGTPRPSAG